jgi:hypothetical protein
MANGAAWAYLTRMIDRITTLERAFELARSGDCASIGEVREKLAAEGYSLHQLTGPTLLKQLRTLCTASQMRTQTD